MKTRNTQGNLRDHPLTADERREILAEDDRLRASAEMEARCEHPAIGEVDRSSPWHPLFGGTGPEAGAWAFACDSCRSIQIRDEDGAIAGYLNWLPQNIGTVLQNGLGGLAHLPGPISLAALMVLAREAARYEPDGGNASLRARFVDQDWDVPRVEIEIWNGSVALSADQNDIQLTGRVLVEHDPRFDPPTRRVG